MKHAIPTSRPAAFTLRLYRAIARTFPQEFRNVYGDELLQTAEDSVEIIRRRHGVAGLARLLLDIAIRVPAEYAAEFRRDIRYGARMLAGSPGFTAVALISLTLGIAVATCAYSEMNGLLRPLPGVANPEELVALQLPVSYPAYNRYRSLDNLFSATFAYVAPVPFGIAAGGRTERTWGHLVTPSYFPALGVRPFLGRLFDTADERPGQAPVMVVSHRYWTERLGADRSVVGRALTVNGHSCTVIGVGPEEFLGASPALFRSDVWLPATVDARIAPEVGNNALERRDLTMLQMVGRLRPGVTEAAAEAELSAVAQQFAAQYGEADANRKAARVQLLGGGRMLPLRKQDLPFFRQFMMVLGSLVLLIACANVANMMLARAAARRREIALRVALGASRARLVRQLLTECLLLAGAAAPPSFLLSIWVMHLLSQIRLPQPIPVTCDLSPDWRALLFTFVLTAATGLAFGFVPALQATRTDVVSSLKEGGNVRFRKYRPLRMRNALVLCQVAASLTLLLLTGYLGLGIQSTLGIQEGFDPANLSMVSLDPVRDGYSGPRAAALLERLLDRVRSLPAVTSACLTDTVPAALDGNPGVRFSTPGAQSAAPHETFWARKHLVGPGYFETAGIKILAGRGFEKRDEADRGRSVVVSQTGVRLFWKGQDPVGRQIEIGNWEAGGVFGLWPGTIDYRSSMLGKGTAVYEVVGVVHDVSEDLVASKSKRNPAIYFPLRAADHAQPSLRGVTLLVRSRPGADVISAVRREISALDSRLTSFNAQSMTEHIAQFMSALTGASWTYGVLGFVGLILASVGLAGVTAYSVSKRSHEIGIRMALGARRGSVLALVMKEGAALVAVGTLAGLALGWALSRAMSSLFFTVASIEGYDPVLLIGGPALLAALGLASCYVPARRSTRIDPAVTLRME